MTDIMLHHYPTSPFSETVRLVLGYKNLSWQSVVIPMIMPKPDVVALTGGYRKTPFMQIGADIYCDAPCIADFAAYHPLWFTRHCTSAMAGILDATPAVLAWMDRMAAIGSGTMHKSNAMDSIAVCASNTAADVQNDPLNSVFQDEHGIPLGSRVSIASDAFGPEPTEGELIACSRMHYTLRRVDERAGVVHVHFPRIGYALKKSIQES